MYKYIIGEDFYEDYYAYEILHKDKFTKKEFLNICREAFNKLDLKHKKKIANSYNSEGAYYVVEILIKEYGFIEPDKTIATIHLCDLHNIDRINCENCTFSYYINEEFTCNNKDCIYNDL